MHANGRVHRGHGALTALSPSDPWISVTHKHIKWCLYHTLFLPFILPLHWLSLVKTCPLQGVSLSLPRTLMIMIVMTMTTSSLKTWRVVDMTCAPVICKDALGYQTPQLPSQSHSSDVLPSPSKGPPGQSYRGRGESVGPRSRTKILTTIISSKSSFTYTLYKSRCLY